MQASSRATADKPNILLILVDDLGLGDLSCQYSNDLRTPNIDRIFTSGVRLDNFYANSNVSSPSRAALLSGRYPQHIGVPGVIRTDIHDSWGYLAPGIPLLPEVLKKNGYKTALIGKWHLGLTSPNTPHERGFDYFHGFLGDMMDDYNTHLRHGINYMRLNEQQIAPKGHATDIFTGWASDYITSAAKEKKPFFMYLAYNAPHVPVQPPAEWLEKVKKREAGITPKRAALVALIEHLDDGVGRVMAALESSGQAKNTIVIFASDNGGEMDAGANNGPIRGQKGQMYEGGIRVAAAIRLDGVLDGGRRVDNIVMLSDLMPTILDMLRIRAAGPMDGISVLPALLGKEQRTDDRFLYWMRREGGSFAGQTQVAVRYNNMKLLQNNPFGPLEMFDIASDPKETTALSLKGPQYMELFKALREHNRLTGVEPWSAPATPAKAR